MTDTSDASFGSPHEASTPDALSIRGAESVPNKGCLLGIDFGTRRVGFAVCDDRQMIVSPLETYERLVESVDAKHLQRIVEDYRIQGLVIGLPVHISGEESRGTRQARQYGDWASGVTDLPAAYWDERFSSAAADVHLLAAGITDTRKDFRRDMLAAQTILQSFLDAPDRSAIPADLRD